MHFKQDEMVKYGTILALVIAIAIPFLTDSMFILNLLVLMLIFIIFASAWNLLAFSGQGSLGHAAFFGIGAYASTLIAANSGMSPFITIFLGAAVAAFVGILIGLTCVRLKEWFLAMVTFGFAIIVQTLTVSVLAPVTGGWDGIASSRLLSPSIPGYQLIEYYAVLVITIASIAAIWYIMKTRIGLAFLAIRENELEARAAGIDPVRYRLLAFALSAYLAGVAGALQIHHIGYLTPELYGVENSFWPVTYVILGGLGHACRTDSRHHRTYHYLGGAQSNRAHLRKVCHSRGHAYPCHHLSAPRAREPAGTGAGMAETTEKKRAPSGTG